MGAQVGDNLGQVPAGPGMVTACQQVRLSRAATPVHRNAGPAAGIERLLQAFDIRRMGRTGQAVQHQHQRCIWLVRSVPVEVHEVAIGQPQALALAFKRRQLAPQRAPKGLQMRVGQPGGRAERGGKTGHAGRLVLCLPRLP
ncbi:hypothetical protein D3C73_1150470 [compost metagenome]